MQREIHNKSDFDKILQRLLTDANYKKVKEFLEKEPIGRDLAITNSSSHASNVKRNAG